MQNVYAFSPEAWAEVDLTENRAHFDAYVPRVASAWEDEAPNSNWRVVDGSLLFVDVSGFTSLSERLARKGRIGAEELTGVLNRVFGEMLDLVFQRGGSLLKFGGDALLLLFETSDHVIQAAASAVEMRAALRRASKEWTSVGRVNLKMSSGIHSGPVDFFLVGGSHRELIVTGPTASMTTEMETTADANEIVVSQAVKDELPGDFVSTRKGNGWLLRKQKIDHPTCGPILREALGEKVMPEFISTGLRDYLAAGVAEPEHRIATIGFIKFKGVDDLLETSGHESVGRALDELVITVQRAADNEGGTFLGSDIDADGGKLILSAGVPTSRYDDEGRMLRAARQILDEETELSVRVGLNRGHVFSGDVGNTYRRTYTVIGDTVNLAARLMAAAPDGSLYASPAVLERAATLYKTEALEPFHVKGKEQLVQAYEVFKEIGVKPPDLDHELPFHGREAELEMIVEIVTTCARVGRGGMMTITGDTGLGKTRLLAEVLEHCPGLDTLMVQAEPNGADNPYWAFRDPLRRMLGIERRSQADMIDELQRSISEKAPDLLWATPLLGDIMHIEMPDNEETASIDTRFRPERAGDALVDLLSTLYTGPFAVLAEDGHWIDDASQNLLRRLGAAAESRPWTVVLTARRERSDFQPLGDEVPLRPLDDESSRKIVIEATAAAPLRPHELDAIVARAGGNPLFLSEILSVVRATGSVDELPESLDAVVSTEIDTLPPLTRQLLRYSSVLGRSFRRVVLNAFLAPEEIALDAATQQDLERFIESDGATRMRFRHSVVHDVAYQGLSYRRRRELHQRAGEVIERLAGEDPEAVAEFLADHYSVAGDWKKAWRFSRVAAEKANNAYANPEAAAHYVRAIEAAGHIDDAEASEVAEIWKQLGVVRELTGQMEAAREAFKHVLEFEGADPLARADIHLKRAGTWMSSGNLSQAKRNVTLARRELSPDGPEAHIRMLAHLDAFEASIHSADGDPVQAARSARSALERAMDTGEEEPLARAYAVLDWANFMLGNEEPRYGNEAIQIYQRLGFLERSVGVMNNMGAFAYLEGNWNEAIDWYEQSLDAAERSGNVLEAALTRANIAEVLIGQRKYADAEPLLAEARRVYEASKADHYMPLVGMLEAKSKAGKGELSDAVTQLRRLLDESVNGKESPWSTETQLALAEALLGLDRPEEALEIVNGFSSDSSEAAVNVAPGIFRLRGLALLGLGQIDAAAEAFRIGLDHAVETRELYEETLLREAMSIIADRGGIRPSPIDSDRLDELHRMLGITSLQPA